MKNIPSGFKKMEIELTFSEKSHPDIIEVFENKILHMLIRDFYIFYSKQIKDEWIELSFYCRPKDEIQLTYRMALYAQCNLDHYKKEYFIDPIHKVPDNFPKCIEISN